MLSSLLTRGVCRGWVRDGQEKSFNKTIYSIGSMTRRDFGAPFFPPPHRLFVCSFYEPMQQYKSCAREREGKGKKDA